MHSHRRILQHYNSLFIQRKVISLDKKGRSATIQAVLAGGKFVDETDKLPSIFGGQEV